MRFLLAFIILYSSLGAFNVEVLSSNVANGKTALLEFNKESGIEYESVHMGKKSFQIFQNPNNKEKFYALIPISYYAKLEDKKIQIKYSVQKKHQTKTLSLKIINGKYQKEEIEVDGSKVSPKNEKIKKRIAREYAEAMKIYNTVSPKCYFKLPFIMPLKSKVTSDFGKARTYNGSLKGYHSGTDFRAKMGTPIIAANDGKIALVKNRFYSGGTILLDHGEGVYTCYFHLSKFNAKKGQLVKKGQILGFSGKSGRVTGPHLHFSARINAIQVDPIQLISLVNNNLLKGN